MYLEVYPDIIFIINFFLDLFLLFLLKKVNRKSGKLIRLMGASTFGAIITVLVSIYPWMNIIIRFLLMNVAASAVMLWIAFGRMKLADFIKQMITLYLITYFVGGLLNSIYYYTDTRETLIKCGALIFSNISLEFIVITILCLIPVALSLLWLYRLYQSEKKETYEIDLFYENKSIHTVGLMDTGNCLYDPIFKKPVMVIENSLIKDLVPSQLSCELEIAKKYVEGMTSEMDPSIFGNDNALRLKIIPYQSIGKARGMMLGLILDKVLIHTGKETICNEKVTAAICDNHLSTKDDYHVILHKELI